MSKVIDAKASTAQMLRVQGYTQAEIAREMGCSTRSVSRYLRHDLEEVPGEETELTLVDLPLREEFLTKAEPLLLRMLDNLKGQLDRGELKARDTILAAGVLFDKIARLTPATPEPKEEAPRVQFVLQAIVPSKDEDIVEGEAVVTDCDLEEDEGIEAYKDRAKAVREEDPGMGS